MNFQTTDDVDANADTLWDIFGRRYADIEQWSSGVYVSRGRNGPAPADAPTAGRTCVVQQGEIQEVLEAYDDKTRSLTYSVSGKAFPFFMKRAANTWSFKPLANGGTRVTCQSEVLMSFPFSVLMGGLIKKQFTKLLGEAIEEVTYYAQHGTPHPRKVETDASAKAQKARAAAL